MVPVDRQRLNRLVLRVEVQVKEVQLEVTVVDQLLAIAHVLIAHQVRPDRLALLDFQVLRV
jgi:hypothetical protein